MIYEEMAVVIEKVIEGLNDSKKIDRFIVLSLYYHVICRKHSNCSKCKFMIELRNIYLTYINVKTAEKLVNFLQKHRREYFGSFFR